MLETTFDHPLYVLGRGWARVEHLEVGDIVPTSDGQATVVGLAWKGQLATVYNFGVEQTRSYLVGELGAWVHNCYQPSGPMKGKRVGHTYSKHGRHNTKQLTIQAANSGIEQVQWLDESAAEHLIADNLDKLSHGAITVPIEPGVGRVILPNGSFRAATPARLVPSGSGVKTAYPVIRVE